MILGGGRKRAPLWKKRRVDPGWMEGRCSFVEGGKSSSRVEKSKVLLCERKEEEIIGGRWEGAPLWKEASVDPRWREGGCSFGEEGRS